MPKKKPAHSIIDNALYLLGDIARHFRFLLVLMAVEATLSVLLPYLMIYLPKLAVDLVTQKAATGSVILSLGGLALLLTCATTIKNAAGAAKFIHYNELRTLYMRRLLFKSFDCDYSHIESALGQTQYQKALGTLLHGDWSGTSLMVTSLMALLPGALSLIIYSGVVAVLNPFVVILLVGLSVANYFALRHAQQFDQRNKDAAAEMEKKLQYIDTAAADVKNGKDIRIYDMAGWFERLQDKVMDRYAALRRKIQSRYFTAGAVNALTLLLRDGAAYVYLIWVASAGHITLGEFVFFFGAITGFSIYVSQIAENLNTIYGASLQMNDMRAFLESTDPPEPENPAQRSGLPDKIGIEFDHVSFSYPGTNAPVLNDLCLTISPGEKVALVGVNGAGKTTLVKLLCGFYRPDSGQILMGGINIDRFLRKDLFRIFSVIFQDITILPFTIAENVSMQLACETEKDRVLACLKMAGLDSDIAKYEKGIDSRMLRVVVDDGVVLSGGQQQKLLMARALYKNAPVFVFDEPTAALDPIAESEVYANFHSIAKDKTAIYISHRLASTRFCDRIAFLKDGRLTECGAHAELMQRGGGYADMFNIQSHYYNHNVEGAVR